MIVSKEVMAMIDRSFHDLELRTMQTNKRNIEYDNFWDQDRIKLERQFDLCKKFIEAVADGRRSEVDAINEAVSILKRIEGIDSDKYEIAYNGKIGNPIDVCILVKGKSNRIWIEVDSASGNSSYIEEFDYNLVSSDIPLVIGTPVQITVYGEVVLKKE